MIKPLSGRKAAEKYIAVKKNYSPLFLSRLDSQPFYKFIPPGSQQYISGVVPLSRTHENVLRLIVSLSMGYIVSTLCKYGAYTQSTYQSTYRKSRTQSVQTGCQLLHRIQSQSFPPPRSQSGLLYLLRNFRYLVSCLSKIRGIYQI